MVSKVLKNKVDFQARDKNLLNIKTIQIKKSVLNSNKMILLI